MDFDGWLNIGEAENHKPNFKEHPKWDEASEGFKREISAKRYAWMADQDRLRFDDCLIFPETEED